MKKTLATILCAGIAAFLNAANVELVLPEQATETEKAAADELAVHLQLSMGTRPAVVSEKKKGSGQKIYIGNTASAKAKGIRTEKMGREEWRICSLNPQELIIAGGEPRGTIYGVYEFLERNLDTIWMDVWYTHIKKVQTLKWPEKWDITGKPSFEVRALWGYFVPENLPQQRFMARNRNTFYTRQVDPKSEVYRLGTRSVWGRPNFCHVYYNYTKSLPADSPILSWSEHDKKRIKAINAVGPGQVCYSNPETVKWFVKKMKEYIAEDRKTGTPVEWPIYYNMMKNDNHLECECPGCRELVKKYGSQNGAQLSFTNAVAREIGKEYPEIILMHDVYGKNCMYPKNIKAEKNVMLQVALGHSVPERLRDCYRSWNSPYNRSTKKLMEDWFALSTQRSIWDYWTDCWNKNYYPAENTEAIIENLKLYNDLNVQWMFTQCGASSKCSFYALRVWIGLRFMNHAELDGEKETERFMNAYYEEAAPAMIKLLKYQRACQKKLKMTIHDYSVESRYDLDDEFFKTTDRLFAEAEKAVAGKPVILERIANERVPVDRARIERYKLLKPDPELTREILLQRYVKNYTRRIKRYDRKDHQIQNLKDLKLFCAGIRANIPELTGFSPEAVIKDYAWPYLVTGDYQNPLVKDPEAFGGNAVIPKGKIGDDITFLVYDWGMKKYMTRRCMIPAGALPQDEKFHWYSIGRTQIDMKSQLVMSSSWYLRCKLDSAVTNPEEFNNVVTIYIRAKVQGPKFVKNSEKQNFFMVDRVVVCRADKDLVHPTEQLPVPEELKGKKVLAELSGTSMPVLKTADPNSFIGCAVQVKKENIWVVGNRSSLVLRYTDLPKDGKYRLYKLGPVEFTSSVGLRIGKNYVPLKLYGNEYKSGTRFEIWVSAAAAEDSTISVDRIFLVKLNQND